MNGWLTILFFLESYKTVFQLEEAVLSYLSWKIQTNTINFQSMSFSTSQSTTMFFDWFFDRLSCDRSCRPREYGRKDRIIYSNQKSFLYKLVWIRLVSSVFVTWTNQFITKDSCVSVRRRTWCGRKLTDQKLTIIHFRQLISLIDSRLVSVQMYQ